MPQSLRGGSELEVRGTLRAVALDNLRPDILFYSFGEINLATLAEFEVRRMADDPGKLGNYQPHSSIATTLPITLQLRVPEE